MWNAPIRLAWLEVSYIFHSLKVDNIFITVHEGPVEQL